MALYFCVLLILSLVAADMGVGIVMRSNIVQLNEEGRKMITSGFFPKIMHALNVAHEDQHHAPLHNILGGVGDVITSWFSSPKQAKIKQLHSNDVRTYLRERRDTSGRHSPDECSCVFDIDKFESWLDSVLSHGLGYNDTSGSSDHLA